MSISSIILRTTSPLLSVDGYRDASFFPATVLQQSVADMTLMLIGVGPR
jgi:hypothetical protein